MPSFPPCWRQKHHADQTSPLVPNTQKIAVGREACTKYGQKLDDFVMKAAHAASVTIPYMLKTQMRTSMDKDALLIALVRRTILQRGMIVIAM